MDVGILGPLRVLRDGVEVDLGRPKQRLLLAVLVAAGGDTVSVDRLVDELWGNEPPPRVAASVQAYVSKLRNALEPDRPPRAPAGILVTRAPGYALHLDADQLDATRFAREAEEVRQHLHARRYERAHSLAGEALGRWRGDVLEDLADEAVAQRERPRWHELRLAVTEDRLHAGVELGLHATAIADLEELLVDHPTRERALALLLRSLYLAGRPVEALERYRSYRTHLQDEQGLDPGAELQSIETAILRQDPALHPSSASRSGSVPSVRTDDDPATAGEAPRAGDALVGRAAELAVGADLVADVGRGRPRWLTLAGEAGIGKTRVAEEIADRASAAGLDVAWGRCHEDDDAPAYWPWTQLLRAVVPDEADPIASLLDRAAPFDPDARRYRLHEDVVGLLLAGAPRLLIVDDVQWADEASLQLLEFLTVQVRDGGIGVVLTLRTGVERPALRRTTAAVARHRGATHRELAPLEPGDLAELAVGLTGAAIDDDAARTLHDRTAGNPFFATELLRLPRRPGGPSDPPLPGAVRDVIERRLAPLGEDVRATLDLAAVVGAGFDLTILEDASGVEVERLFDAVDLAVATGLVVTGDGGPGTFRFAHALVRETLLADLSPMRRQRAHARVAEALEHRPRRDPVRQAAELAHHRLGAVSLVGVAKARDAAERAAQAAEERLAFAEAAGWWEAGRDLLLTEPGAEAEADRLGIAAGRAHLMAGKAEAGRAALCDVMDAAAQRGDVVSGATAGVALSTSGGAWYWVGPGESPADIVERLERASDALPSEDHPLRVGLLATLALGVYYADPARSAALVRRALAIARRLEDPGLLVLALVGAMAGEWGPDTRERHLELSAELLALPAAVRPPHLEVAARLWRLTALTERGELDAADAELEAVSEVADASRLQILRTQVAIARVGRAWLGDGGLAAVEREVDVAAEVHRRSGLYAEEAVPLANRSIVRLLQGRLDEVVDQLPAMYETGAYRTEFEAMVHLGHGDREGAIAVLAAAGPTPATWQWLGTKVLRAMLLIECEAADLAEQVRDDLAPYADAIAVSGTSMSAFGPVALHLGALELLLGDLDAAEVHLRAALATCEHLGATIWGTLAGLHLGRVLVATGRASEARELLARVREDAARLGLSAATHDRSPA